MKISIQYSTFLLPNITGGCGNERLTASSGVFMSPNFPKDYDNNLDCSWTIQVASGPIILNFTSFELEECSSCACDYVSVSFLLIDFHLNP